MKATHEWVEDYRQFEAVLHALNDLPAWEREATLRAFQTFGFDDASTPGNDRAFCHAETGVMLRHDGAYVAIEYGEGDLKTAVADLVHVLFQLGWKDAEVYHPVETMGPLLNDIGLSIPANMDFDVRAAEAVTNITNFAESSALVGREVLALQDATGEEPLSSLYLGELQSMGDELGVPRHPVPAPAAPVQARQPYFDDELPIVPTLGMPAAAPAPVTPAAPEAPAERVAMSQEPQHVHHIAAEVAPAQPSTAQEDRPTRAREASPLVSVGAPSSFKAGYTTFHLQRPGQAIEGLEGEVVHLWPGAAAQPWRWDLLGEVDAACPWFAGALTSAMSFSCSVHAACFEHGLKAWAQTPEPTIRGLTQELLSGQDLGKTFGKLIDFVDQREFVREAAVRLARLGVYGGSEGFMDIGANVRAFNVRTLIADATKRAIVIHVDETDDDQVERIIDLLFKEASRWASSSRAERQYAAAREQAARQAEEEARRKQQQEEGQRMALELVQRLDQLSKAGIQIPIAPAA